MACTFSPNLYLKAQDGHNCDASLWINEQGHISAEPLEMFLWEIRVQVMQNQVAIAMGNRVGTEGDVAFAGQSVVVDPYVNAASEADDQEQLIIADIDLTLTGIGVRVGILAPPIPNLNINLYGLALCGGYANIRQERTNVSPESFRRWCSRCRKSHRFGPLPACPG